MFAPFRKLLAIREIRHVLVAWGVHGLSTGVPLAVVLVVEQHHGFGSAGAVVAAAGVAAGIFGPLRGREVDRHGQTRVLVPLSIITGSALLTLAAVSDAPVPLLAALAALSGATMPPVFASVRALWRDLVPDSDLLDAAYALHAVEGELLYVFGPLAVAVMVAVVSAPGALVLVASLTLLGGLALASTRASRSWRGHERRVGVLGALDSPGMRTLVGVGAGVGTVFGALDVGIPAFAVAQGDPALSGVAIAGLAASSAVGGLLYGARRWSMAPEKRLLVFSAVMAAGLAPLVLVHSITALIGLMVLAGLAIAPATATSFAVVDRVAPSGTATEALAWITSAYLFGSAMGSVVAGIVAEHDPRLSLATTLLGGGIALLVAGSRFHTLSAPAEKKAITEVD